jgi:hypothetical protein
MGISVVASTVSTGDRLADWRDWAERDRPGRPPAHRNGKSATLTRDLAHDVSNLLGVGRHLGSQPRAKTSITIMRAPPCGLTEQAGA